MTRRRGLQHTQVKERQHRSVYNSGENANNMIKRIVCKERAWLQIHTEKILDQTFNYVINLHRQWNSSIIKKKFEK